MPPLVLTPKEVKLILFGRTLGFGEAKVEWKGGEPVRVVEPVKSIVL